MSDVIEKIKERIAIRLYSSLGGEGDGSEWATGIPDTRDEYREYAAEVLAETIAVLSKPENISDLMLEAFKAGLYRGPAVGDETNVEIHARYRKALAAAIASLVKG